MGKTPDSVSLFAVARKAGKAAMKYGQKVSRPVGEPMQYVYKHNRYECRLDPVFPQDGIQNYELVLTIDGKKLLHAVLQPGWCDDQTGDEFISANCPKGMQKWLPEFMALKIPITESE